MNSYQYKKCVCKNKSLIKKYFKNCGINISYIDYKIIMYNSLLNFYIFVYSDSILVGFNNETKEDLIRLKNCSKSIQYVRQFLDKIDDNIKNNILKFKHTNLIVSNIDINSDNIYYKRYKIIMTNCNINIEEYMRKIMGEDYGPFLFCV